MGKLIIPENYRSCLSSYETQEAIGMIKILMQKKLCMALKLKRVTAPLFVDPASGLNDDLNGVERPVSFDSGCTYGSPGCTFSCKMEAYGTL